MKILRTNCIFLDFFVAKRPWRCKQTPAANPPGGRRLCPRRGWLGRDKTEGGMQERGRNGLVGMTEMPQQAFAARHYAWACRPDPTYAR